MKNKQPRLHYSVNLQNEVPLPLVRVPAGNFFLFNVSKRGEAILLRPQLEKQKKQGIMSAASDLFTVLHKLYDEYNTKTPKKLKIVDSYLFYILLTGIIQFGYCCLVGTFPFNSFLSGFISSVGSFILAGIISKFSFMYIYQLKLLLRARILFKKLNSIESINCN